MPQELVWYDGSLHRRHQVSPAQVWPVRVHLQGRCRILTLYVNDSLLLGANKLLLIKLKKQVMDRFEMTDMGDVLRGLSMNVARDSKKETITINQRYYTKNAIDHFGTKGYNPANTPGVEPEVSLNQPKTNAGQGGKEALPIHHGWCHAP